MKHVFVDETGFTGHRLLDGDQPIFVLASHDFTEEESQHLKDVFFGKVQADELKSTSLFRRPANQSYVVDFVEHIVKHPDRLKLAFVHKPYTLLAKFIDIVVEPSMRRQGENLYENGGNLALTNMIYVVTSLDKEYQQRLLISLHGFLADSKEETYDLACMVLREKTGDVSDLNPGPEAQALSYLYLALLDMREGDGKQLSKEMLDPSFSAALGVMSSWGEQLGEDFEVVHDQTTSMAKQKDEWDALVSPDVESKLVGYDRRTLSFPIRINETKFVSSHDWAGVQIADVICGVFSRCLRLAFGFTETDEFTERLWQRLEGWEFLAHVSPELKFTPSELGTTGDLAESPIDFVNNILDEDESKSP